MGRVRAAVRRVWRFVSDPPHMRPIVTAIYACTVGTGLATLLSPPSTVEGEIGPVLAAVWAWCLIGGGLVGLATVWSSWWWLERIGLSVILIGGVGVYAAVIVHLHAVAPHGSSRLTQLGFLAIAALAFVARLVAIWGFSYAPRRGDTER